MKGVACLAPRTQSGKAEFSHPGEREHEMRDVVLIEGHILFFDLARGLKLRNRTRRCRLAENLRGIFACPHAAHAQDTAFLFSHMDKILPLLRKNARASIADLAKASGLSEAEVAAHLDQLERHGVVLGYQAIVDPEKIARESVTAVIEVKLTPERDGGFNKLAERISKFPEVQSCYLMSGGYDLMVVVEGPTLHEVAGFVSEKLSTQKGVISTATHFRLRAYKENGVELKKENGPDRLAVAP